MRFRIQLGNRTTLTGRAVTVIVHYKNKTKTVHMSHMVALYDFNSQKITALRVIGSRTKLDTRLFGDL